MNTPFQWGKQMASHLGGTRDPMVVAWPARIPASGEIRTQFTHCIDLGPTILEAAGVPEPTCGRDRAGADGRNELPLPFDDPSAEEQHTAQYFEMLGSRAMYKDGWWASARLDKAPWDFSPETIRQWGPGSGWDPDKDPWQLYFLPDDFSQAKDLAGEHPEKLKELQDLWWAEAERDPRAAAPREASARLFGYLAAASEASRPSLSRATSRSILPCCWCRGSPAGRTRSRRSSSSPRAVPRA